MIIDGADVMGDKEILRDAIKKRGVKQVELAKKLNISQATLSGNMSRDRMGLDNFMKILDALDYDIYVVDRNTGKAMWTMDVI